MSLAIEYRPKGFDEVEGNESVVKSVEALLGREQKDIPHSWLFTGPSGCGKTTMARLVAAELGCKGADFYEIDAAGENGIGMIRTIREQMGYRPMEGTCRVWLLDECFAAGTRVATPNGDQAIEKVSGGDSIFSLEGHTHVEKVFKNHVPVNRVMRLRFSNGEEVFTTKQHKFLTTTGWKEAQFLTKKDLLLPFSRNTVECTTLRKGVKNDTDLPRVQTSVQRGERAKVLLKKMCKSSNGPQAEKSASPEHHLPLVWHRILERIKRRSKVLLQVMRGKTQTDEARIPEDPLLQGNSRKNKKHAQCTESNKTRSGNEDCQFCKNEENQSNAQRSERVQNDGNATEKRNSVCMVGGARGERTSDRTPDFTSDRPWLANGGGNLVGSDSTKRVSNELQSGHRELVGGDCDRGGWERPLIEKQYVTRCQEDKEAGRVRLESSEVYERGNNDGSFKGVIGSTENNQGFVIFYDLQVAGHPSYFANDMAVHNCHMLTAHGQEALLKALEDTPSHVYFILATTEPNKLKPTLRNRCVDFDMQPLGERAMKEFLAEIVDCENKSVPDDVLKDIAANSLGSSRAALQYLDKIIDLDEDDMLAAAKREAVKQNGVIDLCRSLIEAQSWKKIAGILKGLEGDDPEGIRQAVLRYCNSILLSSNDAPFAFLIMDAFREPFFNNGRAGVTMACYESLSATEAEKIPF